MHGQTYGALVSFFSNLPQKTFMHDEGCLELIGGVSKSLVLDCRQPRKI